jgi:hypothetical protein
LEFDRLKNEANRIELDVNEDKTNFLMVCLSQRTRNLVGLYLEIGDKRFEVMKEFKYLGTLVNNQHDNSIKIKRKTTSTSRAFNGSKSNLGLQKV